MCISAVIRVLKAQTHCEKTRTHKKQCFSSNGQRKDGNPKQYQSHDDIISNYIFIIHVFLTEISCT